MSDSWVIDGDDRCWAVVPDEAMPSGWAVITPARLCLDAWLAEQDAEPLANRIPLLGYGPDGLLANGTVSLACDIEGLASTVAGTLVADPGHREAGVVTMVTRAELAAHDRRDSGDETLQLLHTGRVVLENGARVPRPAAFLARTPDPIGDVVPPRSYPHPGECIPAVFTYGTLMPGQQRWHLIAGEVLGDPREALVFGDLRDTGFGYPALNASADRKTPGMLCTFHPGWMSRLLATLDRVEGTAEHLYTREPRNVGGLLAWVYVASGCAGTGTPIEAWT